MTTKTAFLAALQNGIGAILTNDYVSDEQKRAVVNQAIANLNTDTVNPDHVAHPIIKG